MDKRFFEKRCTYSIRKFTVGAASVMIGATFFGAANPVLAEENTVKPEGETISEAKPVDKLSAEVEAAIANADNNGGREFTKPAPGENADTPDETASKPEPAPLQPANQTEAKPAETSAPKADEKPASSASENKPADKEKTAPVADQSAPKVEKATETQPSAPAALAPATPKAEVSKDEKEKPVNDVVANKEKEDKLLEERQQNFNKDWYFKLNSQGDFSKKDVDVHDWSKLDLPHDWSIFFDFDHKSPARNEGGQLNGGTAWYRKSFTVDEEAKDKEVRINFDGVYMDSRVYVNGKFVGHYPSGYNHFSYNITDFLNKDGSENTIAVQVTNKQPSSRWYSGSGIYRDVTLSYKDKVHVVENGNKITTPKLAEQKDGAVETKVTSKVANTDKKAVNVYLEQQIFTKAGQAVSEIVRSAVKTLETNETVDFDQTVVVNKPELWTTKSYNPQLYVLKTKVFKDNELADVTEDTFGYRYINWTAKDGFFLNGERLKFHGVSIHHDNGALGAEENYKASYRKLKLLKDMGVNSIRTTHNPASPQLLQAAADLGLLVQEEAFDTWYGGKKTYDYGRFFDQEATHPEAKKGERWSDFDLRTMVERDKNNPAIIMWSLGNEVDEANGDARSIETAKRLKAVIKAVDTERYVTMGENKFSRAATGRFLDLAAVMDAVGMNYGEANYEAVRRAHPDWLIYGSETSSATRTRDSYYDPARLVIRHDNSGNRHYEQSDYGNDRVGWGRTATESWTFDRDHAGYAGQFIWTGFDYIGEPTPWHNQDATPVKSSFFGIIDTAGLPKNDFYLYRSEWYSADEKPTVHILPHWNWTEETLRDRKMLVNGKVPVRTFSNADSVELFLNGESLGKKVYTKKTTADGRPYHEGAKPDELYLEWLVDYQPGTLTAVARDAAGKEIARDEVTTANEPYGVRLTKEEHVITADGKDLAYIHYEIIDDNGTVVPTANNLVHFNLHGQGQIVGVDNGEQASRERYKAQPDGTWQRRAFNGKGVVIVKSTEKQGSFTLFADSEGLTSDTATVQTVSGKKENRKFVSYAPVNLATYLGEGVTFPETVTAIFSDGSVEEKAVTWNRPTDLTASKGDKTVMGTVTGMPDQAKATVRVAALGQWLPKTIHVPVGTTADKMDTAIVAVMSDGTSVNTVVNEWKLENADALKAAGGTTTAKGIVYGTETEVSVTVVAGLENKEYDVQGLTVAGQDVAGFKANQTYYRVPLSYSASIPTVGVKATGYTATIQQASADTDNLASVYLTDETGHLAHTYKIQFVKAAPALTKLEVTVDGKDSATEDQVLTYHVKGHYEDNTQADFAPSEIKLDASSTDGGHVEIKGDKILLYTKGTVTLTPHVENQADTTTSVPTSLTIKENKAEKTITGLRPVAVSTDLKMAPKLPSEVMADFDKGLSRKVAVTWDAIPASQLDHYGSFTVNGRVAGTDIKAEAKVNVEGFLVAEEISLTVPKGEPVRLPGNVRAYHSNGTTVYKDVVWGPVPSTSTEGSLVVTGKLAGTNLETKAHIRVSADAVKGANISKQWTGSQLPAAIVSNTGGDDNASTLNDLTISRTNADAKNRWTTWQTNTDNDWAAILFGDAGDLTKRFVDNLTADFYTDGAIGLPKDYHIEYYVGKEIPELPSDLNHAQKDTNHPFNKAENWKEVTNLVKPGQLSASQGNQFSFDKVETYALRLRMKKADGKAGVGLTELTILGNQVPAKKNSAIAIKVDGKELAHFNPAVTDYYVPTASKAITATADQDGLVTVVPATNANEPTRLIHKAEDGSILKEYHIYRSDDKMTALPVAAETLAKTVTVGEKVALPATVPSYYKAMKGWETKELAVTWDALPEHAVDQEGQFDVAGRVQGTDLTTSIHITVVAPGGQKVSDNPNNDELHTKAFASNTNDTQPASNDRVHFVNDGGFNENNRWTNWSRTPQGNEESVGLLFKKDGNITPQRVDKVAIQFFKDSGTDAPESMVLEYYDGPAYTEPATISRYSENADHPFNKSSNWKSIPYKMSGQLTAGHPIDFTFSPVTTSAIRARMTRKASTNGLAMVEFTAYGAGAEQAQTAPTVAITVGGKALEGFDKDKADYTVNFTGSRPEVAATTTGNARVTVVASDSDERPSLVRLVAADGHLVKEYRIQVTSQHMVVPENGDKSPQASAPIAELTEIAFKTIERTNPNLPKGERHIVTKGENGQKVEIVEVTGDSRKVIETKTIPAVDQVVEVGTKEMATPTKPGQANPQTEPNKPGTQTQPTKPVETPQPNKPAGEVKPAETATPAQPSKPAETSQQGTGTVTPDRELKFFTDKTTGVMVIGNPEVVGSLDHLEVQKVGDQALAGKSYDAFDIKLKDKDNHEIQPKGAVMLHLPVKPGAEVENVFYVTPSKELQALSFTQKGDVVEFTTTHFSIYAVVYKQATPRVETMSTKAAAPASSAEKMAEGKQTLPNTGDSSSASLLFLASLSLALSALFYTKGREWDRNR